MSKLFNWAAARIIVAFALALPLAADASPLLFAAVSGLDRNNPVTGETEIYDYNYIGSGEWTASDWQNANGEVPDKAPGTDGSGIWSPMLIDIDADISVEKLNGWELQLGVFGGANVDVGELGYWTGSESCFAAVDEDSSLTISATTGNNWNNTVKFFVANSSGITFTSAFAPANPNGTGNIHYYLKGPGSVAYSSTLGGGVGHVIKQADVTLSGSEKSVQSKTLVSFASTDKTFTADAAIKIKDGDNVLKTVFLTSVTANSTTLTTDSDVGACELVQTSTGIVLYYVDGDPADVVVEEKTYKPSININFTNGAGNGLTTGADVGLTGYEVPGTSWNNYVVANSTFSTVNAVDSTGAASAMSGVSVGISNVSGSWGCSGLTASSDFRQSYIDESASYPTPTVTVSGIPYYKYRVLVYHSTDTKNVPFGYDTINGTNYTYVNDALTEGTTAWGNSGAQNSANAIAEGGNVLVTEALSGSTLTVVGHRAGGANNARGCIAAIQIIEVKADVGENDLEIPVSGDTPYTVEETKELSGTVYLTGLGTLTLAGENKISAATIEISEGVTLVVNADRLDATTFTGAGTVVYNNALPVTGKGWTDSSAWTGTVWINGKSGVTDFNVNSYGNANSAVKLSGVDGWISAPFDNTVPVILENGEFEYALKLTNGNSPNNQYPKRCTTFVKVSGSGTISDGGSANPMLKIYDGTKFTGALTLTRARVVFCAADSTTLPDAYNTGIPAASIYVDSGNSATVASGKTWTADGGFVVNGTLNANGTLASSLATKAVSGAGTVVFGGVPSPTGDAWWKNSDWNGTVQIGNITDMIGRTSGFTGTYLDFNSYGNANSLVKLGNLTGWMDNYTCNVPVNLAGTLTINNGISGEVFTFKKLISSGGYITATDQSATFSIRIEDGSEYAGYIGLNSKRVIFGTGTAPAFVKGQIYVSSDATITVPSVNTAYWSVGGILVDGELKADNLARFGGGTNITTGDDGVFTLTSTGNGSEGETDTDYARIKGTGSLKYDGTGWRALSTNNFPTAVTLVNEQAGDILLSRALTYTVGSLSGSKNFQGNYGSGNRYLNVIQSKDTDWSGKVVNDGSSRFAGLKLDASSTGTLTLSGAASQNVALEVNGGAVNLTGTWVGATTVAGTFGGTGTLTGDLTFSDGATLKANASALTVSGTVTIPAGEGESLTIDATGLDADEVTILSSESITTETDVSKVTVNGLYTVEAVAGALKLVSTRVEVTVPVVAHATATVTVGGTPVEPTTEGGNVYKVAPDSTVTVVYAADAGYTFGDGKVEYTIDTATATTFVLDESTKAAQYIAKIVDGASYTSLQSAFDALENNNKVVLLATTDEGATIPSKSFAFYFYAGSFECGEIADAEGGFVTTSSDETIEIDSVEVTAKKYRVAAAVALVTLSGAAEGTYYGDYMSAYNDFLAGAAGTTMQVFGENPFSTDIPCTTYDTTTQTYTKLEAVASRIVSQMPINYPSLAAAIEAAEAGDTITLLADDHVSFSAGNLEIAISKALTIDGAGYTVYGVNDYAYDGEHDHDIYISGSSDVTIKNVTLANFAGGVSNNMRTYPIWAGQAYAGTLTLDNVTVQNFNRTAFNLNGGTVVVTNCTITGDTTKEAYFQEGIAVYNANVTIVDTAISNVGSNLEKEDSQIAACIQLGNPNGSATGTGSITVVNGTYSGEYGIIVASNAQNTVSVQGGTFAGDLMVEEGEGGTIAVSGGTFDAEVPAEYCADGYEPKDNGDGTYTVREDKGWVYAAPGCWDYTGTWSEGATLGEEKVTISDGATYSNRTASAGQLVTLDMTLSFDDVNDDEDGYEGAKAAIRLGTGEAEGSYVFQLYTYEDTAATWKNATGFAPEKETDYNIVFVLDLTNKTYTASVVTDAGATTNALSVGESTTIAFANPNNATPVQTIDFVGAGTVTSIEGRYEDAPVPEGFVEDDVVTLADGSATLTAAQAAWLNACGDKATVAAKIATMDSTVFSDAHLLNLNVLASDCGYEFAVIDIEVGDGSVDVTVKLTRTGALMENEFAKPIVGTLKLKGTASLGAEFTVLGEAAVEFDANAKFGNGVTESTVTVDTSETDAKFYLPVIE